jgi:hypothetical protein
MPCYAWYVVSSSRAEPATPDLESDMLNTGCYLAFSLPAGWAEPVWVEPGREFFILRWWAGPNQQRAGQRSNFCLPVIVTLQFKRIVYKENGLMKCIFIYHLHLRFQTNNFSFSSCYFVCLLFVILSAQRIAQNAGFFVNRRCQAAVLKLMYHVLLQMLHSPCRATSLKW